MTLCVLLGGLTACQLQIDTIVHPSGTVTTSVHLSEALEDTEFLRELPGMKRYINSWLAQLREQGLAVANWVTGDTGISYYSTIIRI